MNKTEFKERFETDDEIGGTNAYLLSSHGCFQRHKRPRHEQALTEQESITRSLSYRNAVEWSDEQVINAMYQLKALGIVDIKPTESLEAFVIRHAEVL